MRDFIDIVVTAIARIVVVSIQILPESLSLFLSRMVIRVALAFMPRAGAVADRNLRIVFPHLTPELRADCFHRSLNVLARNLFYFAKLPIMGREQLRAMVDRDNVSEIIKLISGRRPGQGVLICMAHFGAYELLAQVFAVSGVQCSILARDTGFKRLDRWIKKRREIFGCRMFSRKGGFAECLKRLGNGEVVVLLVDQNVKRNHAEFIDFFSLPAATTKAPALAIKRTGCQTIVGGGVEERPGHLTMFWSEVQVAGESKDNISILREINRKLEEFITKWPEQWFWIHRRWKTRPLGEVEDIY